jgi:hypothetical protein
MRYRIVDLHGHCFAGAVSLEGLTTVLGVIAQLYPGQPFVVLASAGSA